MKPLPLGLPLRGSRAMVRALRPSDLPQFHRYRADPELALYQGWSPMPEEQALAFLVEMAPTTALIPGQWVQLGIARPDNDLLVGDLGVFLDRDLETAELGFTLAREQHGQGIATQAVLLALQSVFTSTEVQKIRGITDARNAASIRLLGRAGFEKMAVRQVIFKGEACTEFIFEKPRSTL